MLAHQIQEKVIMEQPIYKKLLILHEMFQKATKNCTWPKLATLNLLTSLLQEPELVLLMNDDPPVASMSVPTFNEMEDITPASPVASKSATSASPVASNSANPDYPTFTYSFHLYSPYTPTSI